MEKLLTIHDICELLQVKRSTVYEWTHLGCIPFYKFRKGVRFRSSEIEQWIKNKKQMNRHRSRVDL